MRKASTTMRVKQNTTDLPRRCATAVLLLSALLLPARAEAIPAFARKYSASCNLCHSPAPRLNAFGEEFAANGFLFPGETPSDTLDTGDDQLTLLDRIRFALRLDLFAVGRSGSGTSDAAVDLQTPWGVKLLSGAAIADKISYYMYFFMSERGEVAGLEDAYIQFTDMGGSGVTAMIGQFQLSDPLFKRELRLSYEDYQPYRIRVGRASTDLTYDRGIMLTASPWTGNDVTLQVVNGQGLRAGSEARLFDRDRGKNVLLRASQDLGPIRVGVFGLYGDEAGHSASQAVANETWIWGPDATIPLGSNVEVNLQYLRRTDDNPFFNPSATTSRTEVDAGFAEVIWSPQGPTGRWFVTGLYNHISADAPVVSLRLGEQNEGAGYLDQYRAAAVGAHYLLRRNVRLTTEAGWDLDHERGRLIAGVVAAF
jgi:hypothetical protein